MNKKRLKQRKGGRKEIAFSTRLEGSSSVLMCERFPDYISLTIGSMMAGAAMKIGVRLDKAGERKLLDWLNGSLGSDK